ncbi:MAG: PA14 domain-containing protein [Myxococcota bacterium]
MRSSQADLGFRRARAEVAAALSILMDPASDAVSAEPHILDAWRLLRTSLAPSEDPNDAEDLVAWIRSDAAGLETGERAPAGDLVAAMLVEAAKPALARAPAGTPRAIRRHVRALGRALDFHELGVRGAATMRRVWLARFAKAAVIVGLFVAFVATIREKPDVGDGPWRADYYPTHTFEGKPILQRHDAVDFNWRSNPPHERISADKFSIRWDTCLVVSEPTTARFDILSNDGSRLFVDGELVIDAFRSGSTQRGNASVELGPGVHHLQLDYFEARGHAQVRLRGSILGERPGSIPVSLLRYPGDTLDLDDPCGGVEG